MLSHQHLLHTLHFADFFHNLRIHSCNVEFRTDTFFTMALAFFALNPHDITNLTNLCTVCPGDQTRHLATQLAGSGDGIERDGGQLLIVVLCNHQGALKSLQEAGLRGKTSTSQTVQIRFESKSVFFDSIKNNSASFKVSSVTLKKKKKKRHLFAICKNWIIEMPFWRVFFRKGCVNCQLDQKMTIGQQHSSVHRQDVH